MSERTPAEVFPPSAFIAEELAERTWGIDDLPRRSGLSREEVAAIMAGGRISAVAACGLERALGVSAAFWANADRSWRTRAHREDTDG